MADVTTLLCGPTLEEWAAPFAERGLAVVRTDTWCRDLGAVPEGGVSLALLDADVMSGGELNAVIERLAQEPGIWPVVVSSKLDVEVIVGAMRVGAVDFVRRDGCGDVGAIAERLKVLPQQVAGGVREFGDEHVKLLRKFQHDVKNPINNILGYAELLLENPTTKLTGEPAEFVERIRANGLLALDVVKKFAERVAGLKR